METIYLICQSNPKKFMHDKGGPLLGSPNLNAILKFVFN